MDYSGEITPVTELWIKWRDNACDRTVWIQWRDNACDRTV